jgi:thiol:disulfide interchange protein DsbD
MRRSACLDRALALAALCAATLLSTATQAAEPAFLDVAHAFQIRVAPVGPGTIGVDLTAAPGYHLYRDRFAIEPTTAVALAAAELPSGKTEFDENFGKNVTLWTGSVHVNQPVPPGDGSVLVTYQGCADRGLCYPPQHGTLNWTHDAGGRLAMAWTPESDTDGASAAPPPARAETALAAPAAPATDRSDAALRSGSLLRVIGMFLLGGLLLSFTPCVLPMLPILSSIIVGQGENVSRRKGFTLALAYSLGMALVYTSAGVVAGLLGSGFAAALQNPWVLGSFALMLSGLSLSMFGLWEFQMPGFIQDRISNASNQLSGGRHLAVFGMGGLSALLVGPCVAAPLAGALVYISQTRDVVLGGTALFALAAGMSVPLLLVGLSAGTLLPRAGKWMEHVKTFFGALLLGVALWLVSPVLPIQVTMAIAAGTTLIVLYGIGAFDAARAPALRGAALFAALWAVALLGGALSGGDSLIQPLRHLARHGDSGAGSDVAAGDAGPGFRRITRLAEFDAALKDGTRPVVLDMYADWCVSCKEMAHQTFSDASIRPRLERAVLLQADVTADTADAKALLKRFGLFGPPAVLFFDARGAELTAARTIGYEAPDAFSRRLEAARL